MSHDPADDDGKKGSLWRDGNFMLLWGGQGLSQFGAQITEIALPVIAVLFLAANEFEIGLLNAAQFAAFLLIGLPAGAWIDRLRKRRVMLTANIVRALTLLLIPILWLTGNLEIWHLVVIALVMGTAMVFFDVAYQSLIPFLVPERKIPEANGKLESTAQLANLVGPAVGGWLVGVMSAPLAIFPTVMTYCVSVLALLKVKDSEEVAAPANRPRLWSQVMEGLRWVFGNIYLRRIVITTTLNNLFSLITFTLYPILLLRELGFTPQVLGLILSVGAVGGLLGAAVAPRVAAVIGESRLIVLSAVGLCVIGVFVPVAAMFPDVALWILLGQSFFSSFSVLMFNVTQVSFRQRITPRALLGRMNASIRFCVWGIMPIAALCAGVLGQWIGLLPTLWIGAIGGILAALPIAISPFWKLRDLSG